MSTQISQLNNLSAEELVELFKNETLDDVLADVLKNTTDVERQAIMESVYEDLDNAIDALRDELSGLKDDKKDARKADDDYAVEDLEQEIDELDVLIDDIKALERGIKGVYEQYDISNPAATAEDVFLSTAQIEDGAEIVALGGDETIFEAEEANDEPLTDLDGDGFVTVRDQEIRDADNIEGQFKEKQSIFLQLSESEVIQDLKHVGNDTHIQILDRETGQLKTVILKNHVPGVNLYLDAVNEEFVSQDTLRDLDPNTQKMTFIGDDPDSVYQKFNPRTEEDELAYIGKYGDVTSDETLNMALTYTSGTSSSQVKDLTKQALDLMFESLNRPTEKPISETINEITLSLLNGVSDQVKSDVLIAVVMSLMLKGNQEYFTFFFGSGSIVSAIEDILVKDGLSPEEINVVGFLEMHSGGAGRYGGAENFWNYISGVMDSYSTGYEMAPNHEDWQSFENIKAGMELYEETVAQIGWVSDNGVPTEVIEDVEQVIADQDDGIYEVFSEKMLNNLGKAGTKLHPKGGKAGTDGITQKNFRAQVMKGIAAIGAAAGDGEILSAADAANALKKFLGNLPKENWDGDVAAGIVWALCKKSPNVMRSMLAASPGLKKYLKLMMKDEKKQTPVIEDALRLLNNL